MGLLSRLLGRASGPYSYRAGPDTLGIGVDNIALLRPIPPIMGGGRYGPKYNVRGSLDAYAPATAVAPVQSGPTIDVRGDGLFLSGAIVFGNIANPFPKPGNG